MIHLRALSVTTVLLMGMYVCCTEGKTKSNGSIGDKNGLQNFTGGVHNHGTKNNTQGIHKHGTKNLTWAIRNYGRNFTHGIHTHGRKNITGGIHKQGTKNFTRGIHKHGTKNFTRRMHKRGRKNFTSGIHKHSTKNITRRIHKLGRKNFTGGIHKHGTKNFTRSIHKDGRKNFTRGIHKHDRKNITRSIHKHGRKNFTRGIHKHGTKNFTRSIHKHGRKNFPGGIHKHGTKNFTRRIHKRGRKNFTGGILKHSTKNFTSRIHKRGRKNFTGGIHKHSTKNITRRIYKHGRKNFTGGIHKHSTKNFTRRIHKRGRKNFTGGIHKHSRKNFTRGIHKHGRKNFTSGILKRGRKNFTSGVHKHGRKNFTSGILKHGRKNFTPVIHKHSTKNFTSGIHKHGRKNFTSGIPKHGRKNFTRGVHKHGRKNFTSGILKRGRKNFTSVIHKHVTKKFTHGMAATDLQRMREIVNNGKKKYPDSKYIVQLSTKVEIPYFKISPFQTNSRFQANASSENQLARVAKILNVQMRILGKQKIKYKQLLKTMRQNKKKFETIIRNRIATAQRIKNLAKTIKTHASVIIRNKKFNDMEISKLKNDQKNVFENQLKIMDNQRQRLLRFKARMDSIRNSIYYLNKKIKNINRSDFRKPNFTKKLKELQRLMSVYKNKVMVTSRIHDDTSKSISMKKLSELSTLQAKNEEIIKKYARSQFRNRNDLVKMSSKVIGLSYRVNRLNNTLRFHQRGSVKQLEDLIRKIKMLEQETKNNSKTISQHDFTLAQLQSSNCTKGWVYNKKRCYKIIKCTRHRPCDFILASESCKEKSAYLARVLDQSDNKFIVYLAERANQVKSVMIGGSDRINEGIWMYPDGRLMNVDYRVNKKRDKDKNCLMVQVKTKRWKDMVCYERHMTDTAYVCERTMEY